MPVIEFCMAASWNHKTMSLGRFDEKRKHILLDSRLNLQLKNSKVTIKPDGMATYARYSIVEKKLYFVFV